MLSQKIRQESRRYPAALALQLAAALAMRKIGNEVYPAHSVCRRTAGTRSCDEIHFHANRHCRASCNILTVERNASAYTIKSYREDLTALAEYLTEAAGGGCPQPEAVTVLDLRGYVAALHEAGYAKSSIARRLASLRSFFKFGQREGWTKTNPAKPLRNPRKGRSLPHFLSADEIGRLLAAPPANTTMGLRDRAILETMYSAGLRVSEAVGLNRGDLDLSDGILRVRGKGRKERLAPIGSYAAAALTKWLAKARPNPREPGGPATPVFLNKFGRRLTTRSVARMLEKYLQLTGLGRRAPRRTPCGTVSPRTSWIAGPTSAACRSCWATRAW